MNAIPYIPFGPPVRRTPKTAVFSVNGLAPDCRGNVNLFPEGALAGLASVPALAPDRLPGMSFDELWAHTAALTQAVRRLGGAQ